MMAAVVCIAVGYPAQNGDDPRAPILAGPNNGVILSPINDIEVPKEANEQGSNDKPSKPNVYYY